MTFAKLIFMEDLDEKIKITMWITCGKIK